MPTFFHGWDHFWRPDGPQNGPTQPQNAKNRTCCLQGRESYLESFKCAISHPNTWDNMTRGHKSHFHAPTYHSHNGTRGPKLAYFMAKITFLTILGLPDGNSGWEKKAPTHRLTCFPPCTNLVPPWTTNLEPPEPPMASYVRFMAFRGSFWP